ncbi:MAG TPA: hypothetical protein VN669_01920 [Candidatus Acidoferrales bacterium]|jgi:hypothetical protein|nr:hypothetical protein [Candidatus Acidoferrales bacterium]
MADAGFVIAAALRQFTEDMRLLERQLQTAPLSDLAALSEFRQALDEMRMTAWTVNELHIAQSHKKEALASFLAAERIRRFAQIIRDLCRDLQDQQLTWGSGGIQTLFDSVTMLHSQLDRLVQQHRAAFRDLKDEQG